ncbi:MAG: poly-gamma-glutamate hydrolase family protein [Hyphomicrobiaceae bacterium]
MGDKYRDYEELCAHEKLDTDFCIYIRDADTAVAVIAPHGGKIERGTSELAKAIGGAEYRIYCFEGAKPRNNSYLHLTSANFDEPRCLELLKDCDYVVAVHGCAEGGKTIFLGGRDTALRDAIGANLVAAGFKAGIHKNKNLQGTSTDNICNRGRRRRGVQLEIGPDLRDAICVAHGAERLNRLAGCIRAAIAEAD